MKVMTRFLTDFLGENSKKIKNDQKEVGAYCCVAFYHSYLGVLVSEKDSDKPEFKWLIRPKEFCVHVLNPEDIQVVSDVPLGLRFIGDMGGGYAIRESDGKQYEDSVKQFNRVGLHLPNPNKVSNPEIF